MFWGKFWNKFIVHLDLEHDLSGLVEVSDQICEWCLTSNTSFKKYKKMYWQVVFYSTQCRQVLLKDYENYGWHLYTGTVYVVLKKEKSSLSYICTVIICNTTDTKCSCFSEVLGSLVLHCWGWGAELSITAQWNFVTNDCYSNVVVIMSKSSKRHAGRFVSYPAVKAV